MTAMKPLLLCLMLAAVPAFADITGLWDAEDKKSQVEIFKLDDLWHGKIATLKKPLTPEGEPNAGKPKIDHKNPDTAKRDDPIIGLQIIKNFSQASETEWTGGTIYDPKNGETYKCKITKQKDGGLKVRGFIGVSLIGRTTIWTRAADK
ncbi:MAG: hypothetical protein ACI9TH_002152 [Kiritimatiellia bacterium]|jgi:uncharacterized protein (DUF2147 family)